MLDPVTAGTVEDTLARELHLADRYRSGLRIFQPCAFFQYVSTDRRSNAQRISAYSQSHYEKTAPFRKQLLRAFTIL